MKQRLTILYYAALILILSSQAVYTVYRLGGTVGQGEKLHSLQKQQIALEKDLQILAETKYTLTSLIGITNEDTADYQAIAKTIIIGNNESVASR